MHQEGLGGKGELQDPVFVPLLVLEEFEGSPLGLRASPFTRGAEDRRCSPAYRRSDLGDTQKIGLECLRPPLLLSFQRGWGEGHLGALPFQTPLSPAASFDEFFILASHILFHFRKALWS